MCFAPQRRALFRHLNFQKWSEREVFLAFSLVNVLRATTACTFSTSQLPKVVRSWGVLYILTSKCALRHNGAHFFDIATPKSGPDLVCLYILTWKCASRHNHVQFFISHLASWLRTRRWAYFSSLRCYKSYEKHSVSRLSYLLAHLELLSSNSFSSLIFSLLLFSSLWLFPSLLFICPYCRKFDF